MQKVTPVPSCLADSLEAAPLSAQASVGSIAANDGYRRVRCSAAMIGLAISMSAASILVPNQTKPALATGGVSPKLTLTNQTAEQEQSNISQTVEHKQKSSEKLTPPAIKHQVKQGESIWQLSEEYKVDPNAIASLNNLAPESDLLEGQTLKIPSVEQEQNTQNNQPEITSPRENNSEQLGASLDKLRETRKSLQESLGVLRSPESTLKSKTKVIVAEVAQVPESEQKTTQPKVVAVSDGEQQGQVQQIPVEMPTLESNSLTSVAPQVQNDSQLNLKTPQPLSTNPSDKLQPAPVPVLSNNSTFSQPSPEKTDPVTVSKVEINNSNTPVPIQVVPAQIPNTNKIDSEQSATGFPDVNITEPSQRQTTSDKVYRVQPGDTLNSIARRHGINPQKLARANGINNPNLIKPNQPLVIPSVAQKKPQTNSTVIAGVPLRITPTNSPVSRFPTSLRTIPPSESLVSSVPSNISSQEGGTLNQANPNISEQQIRETHTEKLRADMAGLQQQYDNSQPVSIAVEQPQPLTPSSGVDQRNNDWNNEWQKRQRQNRDSVNRSPSQEQIIGAVPINVEEYNNNLRIPVGETVSPDSPGLSPGEYLPDIQNLPTNFEGYKWPAKGVLTSGYGWRWGRMHRGIDIAAPVGTPIFAAASGQVVYSRWNSGGYGNLVKLKHADGSVTFYAHNSRLLVREGQVVEQGQQISEMGSTGFSTGPHLHFEVHPGGQGAVNPIAFLPRRGK